MICNTRLINPHKGSPTYRPQTFLASLPMISGLWDLFYTTVFLVSHFLILIVNKLTDYFCFYIPAMFMPRAIIFYQIIRKKIVPNYETNSKNIFGHEKRNVSITSTVEPIINLTNSSYNLKSVQIYWPCIKSFIFNYFCSSFSILKCND